MPIVLILEDDPLIALDLAMTVEDGLRADVVVAGTLAEVEKIDVTSVDVAVLDINIGSQTSYDFARTLLNKGVPVIFASGSQLASLPNDLRDLPFLSKPCGRSNILKVIQAAIQKGVMTFRRKPG